MNRTVYKQNKLEHSCFNIFTVRTSNTTSMLRQKMSGITPLSNKIELYTNRINLNILTSTYLWYEHLIQHLCYARKCQPLRH